MMRRDNLRAFADRWAWRMVSVEMIREWRRVHEGVHMNGKEL